MNSIYTYDELQRDVLDYLNTDVELFSTCHTPIDDYYKVLLGNCTDITGYPYSGKTLFLIDILFNLSKSKGFKHLLHLPDSGKPAEVIANLIHKYTGKSFNKDHPNLIKEEEIIHCMGWINDHFKIYKYVQTACIDSWNYMRHESSGTDYLASVLSQRNELAEKSGKHYFTIIHPKNPTAMDYDKHGVLKAPDVFNMMGGSEWNNNGKNIIVVHKESKESFNFDIYFRKIKPRIVGKTGLITLQYELKSQLFYNIINGFNEFANYNFEGIEKKIDDLNFDDAEEIVF